MPDLIIHGSHTQKGTDQDEVSSDHFNMNLYTGIVENRGEECCVIALFLIMSMSTQSCRLPIPEPFGRSNDQQDIVRHDNRRRKTVLASQGPRVAYRQHLNG